MPSQEDKRRELLERISSFEDDPAYLRERDAQRAEELISEAGYVLAPLEPTEAMVRAGLVTMGFGPNSPEAVGVHEAYRAMIAAIETGDE